jgi:hypothetical protein
MIDGVSAFAKGERYDLCINLSQHLGIISSRFNSYLLFFNKTIPKSFYCLRAFGSQARARRALDKAVRYRLQAKPGFALRRSCCA